MQRAPGPVTRDQSVRRRRPDEPSRGRRRLGPLGATAVTLFSALAAAGVLLAVVAVGTFIALSRDLAPASDLEKIAFQEESIVYDRTGKTELARFGETRREVVTFNEIPSIVIDATTAVEDKTFWTNPGFDPAAILAAGLDTLRGDSRGASTITQQLVRQRLLPSELVQDPERRVERKLKEIIQSIRVTQEYGDDADGKQRIITAYLNQNYYGNNTYGIKAAAKGYFGVDDLNDLTLAQAAILAGIPQSPSHFDLYRNAEELDDGRLVVPDTAEVVERRNFILDLLAEGRTPLSKDQFDAADFEAAKREPVELTPQQTGRWTAPHFVWAVRRELTARLCGEEAQTCPRLEAGGLRITTTLDLRLQEIAEKWVKAAAFVPWQENPERVAKSLGFDEYPDWIRRLENKQLRNGALVALDYQTGELLAYVGSADYYAKGGKRLQTKFDVVGDGWRQPGSAFKPFNYATGIDDGTFTAATMFMDVVTDFGGGYTPTDADNAERGPVRVTDALRFSLNIPAVKAMAVNGIEKVHAKAQEFGLVFADDKVDAGLAFALGVEEVHPVDLVTGYGTIANGGRRTGHTGILRIQDRDGVDVAPPWEQPEGEPVISPEAAYIVTNMLAGNTDRDINPFWGKFAIRAGKDGGRRPATLKTGTNNDARDLNAYGYIAPPGKDGRAAGEYALAVGAWNGNSDNTFVSTPDSPLFSIDVTTYVWEGFLEEAAANWTVNDFERPNGLVEKKVDPWTGFASNGGRAVTELFVEGTGPRERSSERCGLDVVADAGFEGEHDRWLQADREWIARARRGPGRRGGPENTPTSYFYNNSFTPYGKSWGPVVSGRLPATPAESGADASADPCASPSPEPSPVCPSIDPATGSFAPPEGAPSEAPLDPAACPSPSPSPSASPSPSPSPEPSVEPPPSEQPTPPPSTEPSPPPPPPSVEPSPTEQASPAASQ